MEGDRAMSDFGKKGGTSRTAGRRAETICAEFCGARYTKRVFFGQRFITVLQAEPEDKPLVQAWGSYGEAMAYSEAAAARYPVAMVLDAVVC
jgi:hypothetical protein